LLQAGWSRVQILAGARDIVLSKNIPDWLWGPPSLLFSGVKRPGCEVNFSHPPNAKVRMSGTVPLLTLYALIV